MLTKRQNLIETMKGGNPDRFVNQYEALGLVMGSPFGKIGICDDFAPHLDSFKRCLENADILGAEHLRLFSFYGTAELDPLLERLRKFIDAARGSGGHSTERDHREKLKWKR